MALKKCADKIIDSPDRIIENTPSFPQPPPLIPLLGGGLERGARGDTGAAARDQRHNQLKKKEARRAREICYCL